MSSRLKLRKTSASMPMVVLLNNPNPFRKISRRRKSNNSTKNYDVKRPHLLKPRLYW